MEQIGREEVDADPETARELAVDQLLERELALELPEEHRNASETAHSIDVSQLDLPRDAERTLRNAADAVLDEDYDGAREVLDGAFRTICEREHPDLREAGDQITACHLYEGEKRETRVDAPTADD
jgi:peptide/nickel transport system ATP-binding protein